MRINYAILVIPFALLSLFMGVIAGLIRLDWDIPVKNLAGDHGALMTGSVVGTLICLERSNLHPCKWWRLLPILNVASILFFLIDQPRIAYMFLIAGSFGLLGLMMGYFEHKVKLSQVLLMAGAFAWLIGNLTLFNTQSYPAAIKWWMMFLLWTIVGERIELSHILPISKLKQALLYLALLINISALFFSFHQQGKILLAVSLFLLTTWLILFDRSRYTIRHPGQPRYSSILLLLGYCWLSVAGCWLFVLIDAPYGYDAALHSFFLGFVFSMILGHLPVIFPDILRMNISLYHPILYIPITLFHLSLFIRIYGDAVELQSWRKYGAMMNGIALALFFLSVFLLVAIRGFINKRLRERITVNNHSLK